MKALLEILRQSQEYLAQNGSLSPRTDSELLIAYALHLARLELYLQFDRPLTEAELAIIRPLLKRRADGEPVQYILGSTEFYNCEILVGPGVMIPRPETERLVEIALEKYTGKGEILDLCTGSGAILFALAKARPDSPPLTGIDISPEALAWAQRNLEALQPKQLSFLPGDLYAPVAGRRFELITANPPYISEAEYRELPKDIREFEPEQALFGGADGLELIRRIAAGAPEYLIPGGVLLCEIGMTQGAAAQAIVAGAGLAEVEIIQDYAKRDRLVLGRQC